MIFYIKARANLFRKRKNEAPGESTVKKGKLDNDADALKESMSNELKNALSSVLRLQSGVSLLEETVNQKNILIRNQKRKIDELNRKLKVHVCVNDVWLCVHVYFCFINSIIHHDSGFE